MKKIESAYKEMMEDVQMSGSMIAYCMKDKALELERKLTAVTEQRDRMAEALDVCLREMLDVIYACNEEIVDANDTFHQAIKLGQKTLAAVKGGNDE